MHNKLIKFLSDAEDEARVVRGGAAVSFTADTVEEVRIYGKAIFEGESGYGGDARLTLLGDVDDTDFYKIKMRIHGRNILSGEELAGYMQENIPEVSFERSGDVLTYTSSEETGKFWLLPGQIPFKPLTAYTVAFTFTAEVDNQSTGFEFAYSDGHTHSIFATKAGTHTVTAHTFPLKSLVGFKQRMAGGRACSIDLSSFGLYEGITPASEFEAYRGSEHTVNLSRPIVSLEHNGRVIADYVNLKEQVIMRNCGWRNMLFGSSIVLHDKTSMPYVFSYTPAQSFDPDYPFYQESLKVVGSYEELKETEYACYLGDGGKVLYMTGSKAARFPYDLGSYLEEIRSKMVFVRPKADRGKVSETESFPTFPSGYVGVEFISNIPIDRCEFFVK